MPEHTYDGSRDLPCENAPACGDTQEDNLAVCAELPVLFKANSISEFVFDNDTIYVLPSGAKPVKLVTEGDPIVAETNEITDNVDMTKEFAVIFRVGAVAIFDRLIGSIEITE